MTRDGVGGSGDERQATGNFAGRIGNFIVKNPEPPGWTGVHRLRLHGSFLSTLLVRCV